MVLKEQTEKGRCSEPDFSFSEVISESPYYQVSGLLKRKSLFLIIIFHHFNELFLAFQNWKGLLIWLFETFSKLLTCCASYSVEAPVKVMLLPQCHWTGAIDLTQLGPLEDIVNSLAVSLCFPCDSKKMRVPWTKNTERADWSQGLSNALSGKC